MTLKTTEKSYLAIDLETSFCESGTYVPTGMHLIPEFEIPIPSPLKTLLWGQSRHKPEKTAIGMIQPVSFTLTTKNLWNLRPLYLFFGAGSYTTAGSTGTITSGASFQSFKLHGNVNDTERTILGCGINSISLSVPKEGAELFYEYEVFGADTVADSGTAKPTAITGGLRSENGIPYLYKAGSKISDIQNSSKLTFKNNLKNDQPDHANNRMYEYPAGLLECEFEAEFRLDTADNFLSSYESGLTGDFNLLWTCKDSESTGFVIDVSGLQIDTFTEPVSTATEGIVTQTIKLIQSEDFIIKPIQVTGVDFT